MAGAPAGRLIITVGAAGAGRRDSLGHYRIDAATGALGDVGMEFGDAGALRPGESFAIAAPAGSRIGSFLIAGGGGLNDFRGLGAGRLRFLDPDGSPATLDSRAPALVHTAADGTRTGIRGSIWHAAGHGHHRGLNADGGVHLQRMGEVGGGWRFGWHDRAAPSADAPCDALVMTVRAEGEDLEFVIPFNDLSAVAQAPSMAAGTLVATQRGPRAVDRLRPGDRLLTRDHGPQPLVWVGRRSLGRADLRARPALRAVRIRAGSLGHGLPERDLTVSPQYPVVMATPLSRMMFAGAEPFVPARDLLGLPGIASAGVAPMTYVQLALARPAVIRAEGAWSEHLPPGDGVRCAFDSAARAPTVAPCGAALPAAMPAG